MSQRAETRVIARSAGLDARAWLAARWFPLGIVAVAMATGSFLLHQLMAWAPHEDETLALFVGRDSLPGLLEQVTRERGGAPLHFLVAWCVAHAGLGLGTLRLVSAVLAVASLPLVALLGRRLASPAAGLAASALVAGSWALLFHGVYARMYSLFLFTSLVSLLTLLRALVGGRPRWWAAWVGALLLCIATHPYGVLVLGGQVIFVLVARRDRWRKVVLATSATVVLAVPLWLSDLVLADRFDVGVGVGGSRLAGPWTIVEYLWRTAGDFSAGWRPVLATTLVLALIGVRAGSREMRLLTAAMVGVPVAAFLVARLGGSTSPESRHLIFVLPLFAIAVAAGVLRVTRRLPAVAPLVIAALVVAEVGWAWQRTPPLFEWEPDQRQAARGDAERYLAATALKDDVLFGYEPLYLGAWERRREFPELVLPRADARLALRKLRAHDGTLGRGVWVLDASERNNRRPRLEIEARLPEPPGAFEAQAFGPFLVVRTREPVKTAQGYLRAAGRAMLLGRSLQIGDADVNLLTIERAERARRGYGASAWLRSSDSR
jgi:hypothetical protein